MKERETGIVIADLLVLGGLAVKEPCLGPVLARRNARLTGARQTIEDRPVEQRAIGRERSTKEQNFGNDR
jgi:hypothetical protein